MLSIHLILFLAFGAVAVAGAVNLLVQRHPINSALSLITVMAALAGEYLLLGAEFVDHYVRTREWEVRQYQRAVTDWELERYFEII